MAQSSKERRDQLRFIEDDRVLLLVKKRVYVMMHEFKVSDPCKVKELWLRQHLPQ